MCLKGVGCTSDGVGCCRHVEVDKGSVSLTPTRAHHHPAARVTVHHARDGEGGVQTPHGGSGLWREGTFGGEQRGP